VDLDRVRASYLRNAFSTLPNAETPTEADIAFLAADTRTDEAYVRRAMESFRSAGCPSSQ
jgi:hypothetical protein